MNYSTLLAVICCLFLVSCSEGPAEQKKEIKKTVVKEDVTKTPVKAVEQAGKTLVLVGGIPITQTDLDLAIKKLIGEEAAARMDKEATRKVLDSMVMSRAISQLRVAEMSEKENLLLDREVSAYREQLLVRRYLAKHGTPQPVTMTMIQEYYDKHPQLFGAKTIKEYEMLTSSRVLNPGERDEVFSKLNDASNKDDWQQWQKDQAANGHPMSYRHGKDDDDVLHYKIAQVIKTLSVGQESQFMIVKEIPYLIRVTAEKSIPAKPLSEVTGTIKKALAPQQVKQAIEKIGKQALGEVEVEYK